MKIEKRKEKKYEVRRQEKTFWLTNFTGWEGKQEEEEYKSIEIKI